MPPSLPPDATAAILGWYDANGRPLAFRSTRDPYAVLVSEVMAQQTQVARVADAWPRFLARFPTVEALAAATPADVLREWRGMGYDRRALNLRRAAIAIRDEHGGRVPDDLRALTRLPGVGPYTARAVLAIAFGRPVGAVDTNVRRVLTRMLGSTEDGEGDRRGIQSVADASVDPCRPGDWTHAVMDLGATVCRAGRPACERCPVTRWCAYRAVVADTDAADRPRSRRARPPRREAGSPRRFETTTRWLRGRILDRLRSTPDAAWTDVAGPIGVHDEAAVDAALTALVREGHIELRAGREGGARPSARLATSDAGTTELAASG